MAAKDADLARDHIAAEIFLVEELIAELEVELEPNVSYEPASPGFLFLIEELDSELEVELGPTPSGSGGGGVTYRMRANDTTLGYPVYWDATSVDSAGTSYAGPGPLTDIVVSEVIGT